MAIPTATSTARETSVPSMASSWVALSRKAPIQIPDQVRVPSSTMDASAIPDGGQTGVASPGGMAIRSPILPDRK